MTNEYDRPKIDGDILYDGDVNLNTEFYAQNISSMIRVLMTGRDADSGFWGYDMQNSYISPGINLGQDETATRTGLLSNFSVIEQSVTGQYISPTIQLKELGEYQTINKIFVYLDYEIYNLVNAMTSDIDWTETGGAVVASGKAAIGNGDTATYTGKDYYLTNHLVRAGSSGLVDYYVTDGTNSVKVYDNTDGGSNEVRIKFNDAGDTCYAGAYIDEKFDGWHSFDLSSLVANNNRYIKFEGGVGGADVWYFIDNDISLATTSPTITVSADDGSNYTSFDNKQIKSVGTPGTKLKFKFDVTPVSNEVFFFHGWGVLRVT